MIYAGGLTPQRLILFMRRLTKDATRKVFLILDNLNVHKAVSYTHLKPALDQPRVLPRPCPCCGGRMIVIETFARGCEPKHRPTPPPIRIDTS